MFQKLQYGSEADEHHFMTIEEARNLRGEKYENLSDDQVQAILDLINGVCIFVINTELSQLDSDHKLEMSQP